MFLCDTVKLTSLVTMSNLCSAMDIDVRDIIKISCKKNKIVEKKPNFVFLLIFLEQKKVKFLQIGKLPRLHALFRRSFNQFLPGKK